RPRAIVPRRRARCRGSVSLPRAVRRTDLDRRLSVDAAPAQRDSGAALPRVHRAGVSARELLEFLRGGGRGNDAGLRERDRRIEGRSRRVKIGIVVGTRPEIIKMAPVVRACVASGTPYLLLHTGQHYSFEMDGVFFQELGLPPAHHNLEVGSGTQV